MLLKAGVDIGVKKNIVFRWQPPAGHDVSILHLSFISSFKEARRLLRKIISCFKYACAFFISESLSVSN